MTILGAAVLVVRDAPLSPVALALVALHAVAAWGFVRRRPPIRRRAWQDVVLAVPGVLGGAVVVAVAPSPPTWPVLLQVGFVLGALGGVVSLAWLGRSFGVLPGVRGVVHGGPYAFVRHPAYLSEGLALLCAGLAGGWPGVALASVALLLLGVRIRAEERVLRSDVAYHAYAQRVPFRLIPGVW